MKTTTTDIAQTIRKALRLREKPQVFKSITSARKAIRNGAAYLLELPTGAFALCRNDATCDRLCNVADATLIAIAEGGKWFEV